VSGARRDVGITAAERGRIDRLQALVASGAPGLADVLAMLIDPSWAVRREVIAALGQLGELSLAALCASLIRERDDETRIAATVDSLVASTGDVDACLRRVVGAPPAVLADVAQILGRRRSPGSVPALAELARHDDDNVAVAAIEGLGKIGGRAVVDALVEAVQSQSFFRTFAAIDVLGKSGDPRAIAPLAALLGSPHYAHEAARSLGRTCDRAAAAPLAALLLSPSDALVRVAALALADLRQRHGERLGVTAPIELAIRGSAKRGASRRLVQCLNDAEADEQVAIHVVLGCLGDDAALPTLLRALDGPPPVARAAAEALERSSGEADEALLVALWEGDSARRQMLLPRTRHSRATDAVIACLNDGDARVRRLACEALAQIGSRRAAVDLFDVLKDGSPAVVQAAAAAIISLGHEETASLARAAAQSQDTGVRRAALRILSHIGIADALDALSAAARDENPKIREAAIVGLSLFEQAEASVVLLELSNDTAAPTRGLALRSLGDGGWRGPAVSERLRLALEDADAWVRYYACQAIGKLKLAGHVAALAARLDDSAGQVRVAAIEALSHLPDDTAFSALLGAASSEELDVRRAALIGLGLSARTEVVGLLLRHVDAEDAATRLITLSALANFDTPQALEALARAARDEDESVRMAAIGFLGARSSLDATRVLTHLVTDAAVGDRARAALAVPNPQRVAGLSAALQTADDELAVLLAALLARLNRPEATAALFEAVTLPNAAARRAAATTLGALRTREALATLQRLSIEDPDAEMRRICALLLSQ